VKNAFKGLGRNLAALLVGRGPQEIQAVIDKRVFEILNDLSHPEYNREGSFHPRLRTHNAKEEGYER
jgi:hypothetical protein